jgi:hypothetical protein
MFLLIELAIVIVLFVGGCWSRRVATVFLPVVVVLLVLFGLRFGNPIDRFASGGGWIILDNAGDRSSSGEHR